MEKELSSKGIRLYQAFKDKYVKYYELLEQGNEIELDFEEEFETDDTHYEIWQWEDKDVYILKYGSYGNGWTDLLDIEFFDTLGEAKERMEYLAD